MLQPRSNRLPQNVTARPRKAPLTDPNPQELSSRPLNIGVSEDVAEQHSSICALVQLLEIYRPVYLEVTADPFGNMLLACTTGSDPCVQIQ